MKDIATVISSQQPDLEEEDVSKLHGKIIAFWDDYFEKVEKTEDGLLVPKRSSLRGACRKVRSPSTGSYWRWLTLLFVYVIRQLSTFFLIRLTTVRNSSEKAYYQKNP